MPPVVLASASPRRHELLRALVDEFTIQPSAVDERLEGDPAKDAARLAVEKAADVARAHPGSAVIGSDTIVHDGSRAYGKPTDEAGARQMLTALAGRWHEVHTGVAIVRDERAWVASSVARVQLTALDAAAIAAYVASGRPLDKAGAYAIQDEDVPTVAAFEGCYCGVVGLPLWRTRSLLSAAGAHPGHPERTFARCGDCPDRDACIEIDEVGQG